MKRLTFGQANACETAKGSVCKCRCGGALHGVGRVDDVRELPEDDPHYVHPEETFREIVKRIRGGIYAELRRPPDQGRHR